MDKMQMAHEYLLRYSGTTVAEAWAYADAMQAEADKRKPSGLPDALKEEWQPDWSQAPEWAVAWVMTITREYWWTSSVFEHNDDGGLKVIGHGMKADKAPSFNYQGNWQDSLRERPE